MYIKRVCLVVRQNPTSRTSLEWGAWFEAQLCAQVTLFGFKSYRDKIEINDFSEDLNVVGASASCC